MDGNELPPLNFSTTCTEYGRYVVFYNERLTGVKYPSGYELENVITELCEVTVHACTLGWYGQNCSKKCIGHCKDNSFCNHVTGMCDKGCDGGWTGELCNEECHYGTYGYNCVNNCSGHCRNDTPCNKQTGVCDKGCNPGYTGLDCKGTCTLGWYGQNCSKKCIGHCKDNSSCNHVTGMCDKGCDGGWTGKLCNDECGDGTYGYNCVNNCSSHCLNNTPCHKQTGNCERGCKQGYTNNDCKKSRDVCVRVLEPGILHRVTCQSSYFVRGVAGYFTVIQDYFSRYPTTIPLDFSYN
uniref:Multiple epidermal growth factor-like domains 10 n=1 Tax=Magallana gigas TaxID=29159 RepID=K1PWX8_MAGGI